MEVTLFENTSMIHYKEEDII